MTYTLEIRDLSHWYGDRQALKDIALQVPGDVSFGILGPNGSGKSTLFRIVSTLLRPQAGVVKVCGIDAAANPGDVRSRLGVAFQSSSLDDKLTVYENLRHHGHLYGLTGRALRDRVDLVVGRMHIADRIRDRVETLSGGLRRRVELARCLLHEPRVLLLDEPTSGLDPASRRDFWELLMEIRGRDGTAVCYTTHLFEEAEQSDLLAIMDQGDIVACDNPGILKAAIGRGVVTITTGHPEVLRERLSGSFDFPLSCVNNSVRIENCDGSDVLPKLLSECDDLIESVTSSKASLEDVYIHQTGRKFEP